MADSGYYAAGEQPRAGAVASSLDTIRAAAAKAKFAVPFGKSQDSSTSVGLLSSSSAEEDGVAMQSALRGVGGGLSGAALLPDRHRKISRYWRLRKGTACFRFTLLALSIIIVFAGYFAFDLPSITAKALRTEMGVDNEMLGVLFSVYALPNAIIPMLSGAFFSRVGKWRGVVLIAAVITTGVMIVGAGVLAGSYPVMVFGRAVYGCGGESVYVGIEILVTKWFKGAEIGLAYGAVQAMGQAGSFSAFYFAPPLLAAFGNIRMVYVISIVVTGTALACLAMARVMEITSYSLKATDAAKIGTPMGDAGDMHHSSGVMHSGSSAMAAAVLDGIEAKKAKENKVPTYGASDDAAKPLKEGTIEDDDVVVEQFDDFDTETDELTEELARLSPCPNIAPLNWVWKLLGLSHLRRLKWDFWAVLASIACYSSAFYTFLAFGNAWLIQTFNYDEARSGQTVGIVSIFSMVVSPIVGVIMDKRGGQRYAAFFAMCGACFWFAVMGFTPAPPVVTVLFAGSCYAVLPAALYPLLVETVPDESFTVVYAIVNSAINLVLTAAYYFAGAISNVKGEGEGVGATRRMAMALSGMMASPSTTDVLPLNALPHLLGNESGNGTVEHTTPGEFRPVFVMFCCITGVGVIMTGMLARQQWLGQVGYVKVGGHGHH